MPTHFTQTEPPIFSNIYDFIIIVCLLITFTVIPASDVRHNQQQKVQKQNARAPHFSSYDGKTSPLALRWTEMSHSKPVRGFYQ